MTYIEKYIVIFSYFFSVSPCEIIKLLGNGALCRIENELLYLCSAKPNPLTIEFLNNMWTYRYLFCCNMLFIQVQGNVLLISQNNFLVVDVTRKMMGFSFSHLPL